MKKAIIITVAVCVMLAAVGTAVPLYLLKSELPETPELSLADTPVTAVHGSLDDNAQAETEPPPEPVTITLSFAGDCMLATDRGLEYEGSFNHLAKNVDPSYFFEGVADIFEDDDWTVVNLENVFTDNSNAKPRAKGYTPAYWYKSATKNTDILKAGNVEIVSLANNHSEDYGSIGYADTRDALEAADILWGDNSKVIMLEKEGFTIALYLTTFYYNYDDTRIIKKMAELDADYKIVYFHGGTERVHTPDSWKAAGARRMIDGGIDLVIGGHPHVLQPMEMYNGKRIVHSLGNFVFGGSVREENRTMIYRVTLTTLEGELVDIAEEVIPCYVYTDRYKPGIITDQAEIDAVNAFLAGEIDSPMGAK